MVDSAIVKAGEHHRRSGKHIDGYWLGSTHGDTSPWVYAQHRPTPTHGNIKYGHGSSPDPYIRDHHGNVRGIKDSYDYTYNHHGNVTGTRKRDPGERIPLYDQDGRITGYRAQKAGSWVKEVIGWGDTSEFTVPESIILASNISACMGYVGDWQGTIADGGDVSNCDLSKLIEVPLEANIAYRGNVGFVHETLVVAQDVERTVVRLNLRNH